MPVPAPKLGAYDFVEETKENLDWAELITVDLSKFDTEEGKKELSKTLIEALRVKGFFYVKNFGISQERVNQQFSLGRQVYELPLEERLKFVPEGLDEGKFNGYIPHGRRIVDKETGLRDHISAYNIPKFNEHFPIEHPDLLKENIAEVESFARDCHTLVLDKLHRLLAIALELPEDFFTNIHQYEAKSEDHLRYMMYLKHKPEDNARLKDWAEGHTDLGSFTLLFRQPVAGLQIRHHDTGEWKWVKPENATLTVNSCDALQFLTGGYVKSTVHRVNVPPKDQQHVDRLGLMYFARPHNDVKLATIDSPVLKREGFTQNAFEKSGNPVPTMEEFTFAKQKWQRVKGATFDTDTHKNAVILPGFTEQRYV